MDDQYLSTIFYYRFQTSIIWSCSDMIFLIGFFESYFEEATKSQVVAKIS